MARALSNDLRSRVLAAAQAGMSARAAGKRFGVGVSTAISWVADARRGQLVAGKQGRPPGSRLDEHAAFINAMIEARRDITLNEMVARLLREKGLLVARSAVAVWLQKHHWRFDKKLPAPWHRVL